MPYEVTSPTNPQTVYGRTKLEGETAASETCSRVFIVRTSWVYGKYGTNFVRTMLQLAEQKKELSVVHDQLGSPTYTFDLAAFLLELVRTNKYGTYHASNSGTCTWYDFASAIFEEAKLDVKVIPCTSEQFPRPARRQAFSVLGHNAIIQSGFKPLRHWREAMHAFFRKD